MPDSLERPEPTPDPDAEQLKGKGLLFEIVSGVGIALGLSLLWVLEIVRNAVFRLLDRANIRARIRRASAFPPGQARKRAPLDAHR